MNEKRIQQVLDIEKQAQNVYDEAVNEAKQIPLQAEQEAQAMIDNARAEAEEEARKIVEQAKSDTETRRILEEAEEKVNKAEQLAKQNLNRAVTEVLSIIAGKE